MTINKFALLLTTALLISGCATTQETKTAEADVSSEQATEKAENTNKETRRVCQESTQVGSRLNNRSC